MAVIKIRNRLRIIYGVSFLVILATEICIALFVHDSFVRPYVGDMLVSVLICCFVRFFIPERFKTMPILVFIFSALVEIGQYFDFVRLLGLEDNLFISTLLGRTFSFTDLICYAIGCAIFAVLDYVIKRKGVFYENIN